MWEKICELVETDRSGSIVPEEEIRRGDHIPSLDIGFAELILIAGWYLWWERRQFTHGEHIQHISRSGLAIVSLAKNYKLASKSGAKLRQGWRKPTEGYVMLNIDASFDDGCGSTCAIIRDGLGAMIAASSSFISHLVDAPMENAYALKKGLMLA
jgi:hypothetical protein